MQSVAFTSGEVADAFLLLGALEVEAAGVGARGNLVLAYFDNVLAFGNLLPHAFVWIQRIARLIDIGQLHGFAHTQGTFVWLLVTLASTTLFEPFLLYGYHLQALLPYAMCLHLFALNVYELGREIGELKLAGSEVSI